MQKLGHLLRRIKYTLITGSSDIPINALCRDSRKVCSGAVFVALRGYKDDGHLYIKEAIGNGAAAVVVEEVFARTSGSMSGRVAEQAADWMAGITVVSVEDTRAAFAELAAAFYGYPAEDMRLIGVTGTKGKTTAAYMMKQILEYAEIPCGLMGTIEILNGKERISASNTTCEADVIQKNLRVMRDQGIRTCIIEVSSQGLKLMRTKGLHFASAIFTNIGKDHIGPGEHKDFEEYLSCKSLLFLQAEKGFFYSGDPYWEQVRGNSVCETVTFGEDGDYFYHDLKQFKTEDVFGVSFQTGGRLEADITLPLPGKYNALNALAAAAVCHELGVKAVQIEKALADFFVKGRMERVFFKQGVILYIDYAHNAMSLRDALLTLREYEPKRIICVFGCGGGRSRLRRFEMGEVSGRLADFTIATTDNPRYEAPEEILSDIRIGLGRTFGDYIEIIDRKEAIAYAMELAEAGDVVLLAGKGHEDYEERMGVFRPMDERQLIREILEEKNGRIRQYYH